MKNAKKKVVAVAIAIGSLATMATSASAWQAVDGKVHICHATHSKKHPYVLINAKVKGILNGHDKHDKDIIPDFEGYPGKNMDKLWILLRGCNLPDAEKRYNNDDKNKHHDNDLNESHGINKHNDDD